jgi:hypothetical protein
MERIWPGIGSDARHRTRHERWSLVSCSSIGAMEGCLDETKSGNYLIDSFRLQYAYTFTETALVDRGDLRCDNDALLRQAAFIRLEKDDARLRRSI